MIKNSAIYISDPAMIGSRLFDRSRDIISYECFEKSDSGLGFKLKFRWGEINCNIMPAENVAHHLNGFKSYMSDKFVDEDDLIYFLSRLNYVQTCLGLEISHDDGAEDDVHEFLFSLNEVLAGLLYMHDTVWDWSRTPLVGVHKSS